MSTTETASARYATLEDWSTSDLVAGILEGQYFAIGAVQSAGAAIAKAIDMSAERLSAGGRLIYIGAGTSGRISTQDAAELPPTFNWPSNRAISLMAGGEGAFLRAKEGAEDDEVAGVADLDGVSVGPNDVVIGVAASGRTPYVIAGLKHARKIGALTIGIYNNRGGRVGEACELPILIETGPEILAGSTRMKAGTAQKAALNCISTGVMIRLGFVYRGKMVEMQATNAKLRERGALMVADLTGADIEVATKAFAEAGQIIKVAVVMLSLDVSKDEAVAALARANGNLRRALVG
ncbi:N-acetylmuramic acid 6-phosphate etherase [Paradevosia shaoguanensis]|uniref:N-acetylmuramic acid 6-phosphate etherase n=1 Tax=Paradevosia shaoguanensis TaxID=1335043 RepID=A0AA41QKC9_9HYPH|nr:N-acetylmuramic acid 6-phosphate etherase [Paradevosia shaoguanensis]MCF1741989.1 N-acetylmuramic acid 6-phosphate etherase [Paradevosia shaoguanensis]MCI0126472.1 N-acetylmuramic acid 6-phosphate etherase [Paradevosia shaoguanensis]CDP49878.1 N-acetylmuramic acid 6-phosphate etherase [Devosia sp. DBB001]